MTTFSLHYSNLYFLMDYCFFFKKNVFKLINIIFSQISNVNTGLYELKKLNIIRKYLNKSYQGYCHAIGKPVRGQRTWSNAWNSFKCNNTLRGFINKTRRISLLKGKNFSDKINFKVVKKRYSNKTSNLKPTLKKSSKYFFKKTWY